MHFASGLFSNELESVAIAIALTTTALGTLMPILKERGLMGTQVGESVLAYGTWGELGPVLAIDVYKRQGLRYCINSAALRFVPYARMDAERCV